MLATAVTFPVTSPDMIYKKRENKRLSWLERHKKRNIDQVVWKGKSRNKIKTI